MENYYDLFFKFLETFKVNSFRDIDEHDPLMALLEKKIVSTGQFFQVVHVTGMKVVYVSGGTGRFFGTKPEEVDPGLYFERTHPDDMQRHNVGRSKVFRMGNEMFINKSGRKFLSSSLRMMNGEGEYIDLLYQIYVCYFKDPVPAVYFLQVNTDVTELKKEVKCDHYYVGDDESMFRYPDKELLCQGLTLSDRESEIIRLIAQGLDSEQIAEKLFLSIHTVNTHRRNILEKTGHRSTLELVIELQERGMI